MYKQSKVPSGVDQGNTHQVVRERVREAQEIPNTVCPVFVEGHLFLPVLLLCVLHLC